MSKKGAERDIDSETCHRQARAMLDAAASANTESQKVEFLRLAMEWLKLATEISKRSGCDLN